MTPPIPFQPTPVGRLSSGSLHTSRGARRRATANALVGSALLTVLCAVSAQGQGGTQGDRQSGTIATRTDSAGGKMLPGGATISASAAQSRRPATTLADLIAGRFAGLDVLTTGASGTGSRLRVRGQSTFVLNNDPLVIVDGVRLFGSKLPERSSAPSRLDDINVEDIDDIELLSGPAATARYGPYATNGVINVTTRTGAVGRAQVRAYADGGIITDPNTYSDLWALWGKRTGQTASTRCSLAFVSAGTCTVDSLSRGNVMNIDSLTPVDRGYRTQAGVQVSGGSQAIRYFVSADREDETGVYRMPKRDQQFLQAERSVASLPKFQTRPSAFDRTSLRANVSVAPMSSLRFDLTAAYVDGTVRLVPNEDNSNGIGANAFGGPWQNSTGRNGFSLAGYRQLAGDLMSQGNAQDIGRFIGGLSAEYKLRSWLSIHASHGRDNGTQTQRVFLRRDEGPEGIRDRGLATHTRDRQEQNTSDIHVSAKTAITSRIMSTATAGWQMIHTGVNRRVKIGSALPAGSSNPNDGVSQVTEPPRVWYGDINSFFVTEQLHFDKTLGLSATLRHDTYAFSDTLRSSFGTFADSSKPDGIINGSLGVTWTLSGHAFMQNVPAINLLRLRAGYGLSHAMPDVFNGSIVLSYTDDNSIAPPNAPRPEANREWEVGTDLSMFDGASMLQFTYFNKSATDVSVPWDFTPSLRSIQRGASVSNRGIELSLQQRLIDNRNLAATVALTGSTVRNRVEKLYEGVAPLSWGNRNQLQSKAGYPMYGFWQRSYTYTDANNDGILTSNEMTFSDFTEYFGESFPTKQISVLPTVELFNHNLRINAQIDSKWGFKKFNNTLRHQCQSPALSCRGLNDRSAPLEVQAAALAASASQSLAGMIEDGAFTRLREVTVAVDLPDAIARATRSSGWTLMLTGRNLGVSTNYTGVDPESSASATDAYSDEFFSTPLPRTFLLRLNVRF